MSAHPSHPRVPKDLAALAARHADLDFGAEWIVSASGPDRRYVWARPRMGAGPLRFSWSAAGLADLLEGSGRLESLADL
jgi:hypothetical protein